MPDHPPRRAALFGATGSIGRQTLEVMERMGGFKVEVLSAGSKWQELAQLALIWKPRWVALSSDAHYKELADALSGLGAKILCGAEAAAEAAREAEFDICVNGLVGVAGLLPSYEILMRGIDLALANKESLVLAGDVLNEVAARTGAAILPVDSEHSAILQCLQGENAADVRRLILTASGGPFLDWDLNSVQAATVEQALNHPTWAMGPKITVDSATLMNKGLEVIEAHHLFHVPVEKIAVVIHPQSIVHSMVEFADGSIKAQLGRPDMRLPIQYALTYPRHTAPQLENSDPLDWGALEFKHVETERYPCLGLAMRALEMGGTTPAVLNGADESAVGYFLEGKAKFGDIAAAVEFALDDCKTWAADSIVAVLAADQVGRRAVREWLNEHQIKSVNAVSA